MSTSLSDLQQLTDEQLCAAAAGGNADAEEMLAVRYSRLVRVCARPLFLAGGDSEDLIQEGMFGLLHAIRTYDAQRQAQLRTYAEVCIRHRLYSAVRAAGRDKHAPLNDSVSLEDPDHRLGAEVLPDKNADPEALLIGREEWSERLHTLQEELSALERTILQFYLSGLSYGEIAQRLARSQKSIDNAIQRIRRKVTRRLSTGDISKG